MTGRAGPAWVRCTDCGDYLCTVHAGLHVADCDCPPVDEWECDPYSCEEPTPMHYLSQPVTIADADYTAAGQVLLVVLPCGLAMWVPAGEVEPTPQPATCPTAATSRRPQTR